MREMVESKASSNRGKHRARLANRFSVFVFENCFREQK
jgi:hypothetical protein